MKLRRAHESDAVTLLHWRNDPSTVAMCASGKAVDPETHYRWIQKVLTDPTRYLFIAAEGTHNVGTIRFDHINDEWLVNITVAPGDRGKGYGAQILRSGILRLGDYVGQMQLAASIRPENAASIRLFERCGFTRDGETDGLLRFVRH